MSCQSRNPEDAESRLGDDYSANAWTAGPFRTLAQSILLKGVTCAGAAAAYNSVPSHAPAKGEAMPETSIKPRTKTIEKVARPPLHKVILLNDDYTPREFVVRLLKAEFRVPEAQGNGIMLTAHTKGACVVAGADRSGI